MIVTTASKPDPALIARAQQVAERCQVAYAPRRGALPDGLVYVVGRDREELRGFGHRLAVHLGLLHARVAAGRSHPLIAALTGGGEVRSVVDGTVGLAGDALHIATVLGCPVLGIEGSGAVYSLLEEGLARLASEEPAAARVTVRHGDAATVLDTLEADSADAVYLSPMYEVPRQAAPGFELLRAVAIHAPLDERLLAAASRVARHRVVVKVGPGDVLPVGSEIARVRGRAVDYAVVEPG